mmetsp:Transcript_99901/g.250463  ORF Transcript_99901/g.250463 Transcript_99901/m.250463 type:complete len:200 (-) Transcript_99901:873-1472(-)
MLAACTRRSSSRPSGRASRAASSCARSSSRCRRSCGGALTSASPPRARNPSATSMWNSACWACPPWAAPSVASGRCRACTSGSRTPTRPGCCSTHFCAPWTTPWTCPTRTIGRWLTLLQKQLSRLTHGGRTSRRRTRRRSPTSSLGRLRSSLCGTLALRLIRFAARYRIGRRAASAGCLLQAGWLSRCRSWTSRMILSS